MNQHISSYHLINNVEPSSFLNVTTNMLLILKAWRPIKVWLIDIFLFNTTLTVVLIS